MPAAHIFAQSSWTSVINIDFRDYKEVLNRVSWEEGNSAPTQIIGENFHNNVPRYNYYGYSGPEDFKHLIREAARSIERRYGRTQPLWIYAYKLYEGNNSYSLYKWNNCWFIYANYYNRNGN
jgi:hypothetical protein